MVGSYPVQFDVDFPARPLDRLTTAFRIRWGNRVTGYAFVLVTDQYPPFSLR